MNILFMDDDVKNLTAVWATSKHIQVRAFSSSRFISHLYCYCKL